MKLEHPVLTLARNQGQAAGQRPPVRAGVRFGEIRPLGDDRGDGTINCHEKLSERPPTGGLCPARIGLKLIDALIRGCWRFHLSGARSIICSPC